MNIFSKITLVSYFTKIRPVGGTSYPMRTDGKTDMTRFITAFRNFANAPKKTTTYLLDFLSFFLFEELNAENQMLSFTVLIFSAHFAAPWTLLPMAAASFTPTPSYAPVCDRHNDTAAVFPLCTSFFPSQLSIHQYTRLLQYAHCSSAVRTVSK